MMFHVKHMYMKQNKTRVLVRRVNGDFGYKKSRCFT